MILYYDALLAYSLCNFIKIVNLLPYFGSLKTQMEVYRKELGDSASGGIVEYYIANRDLRILLDLLANNYGLGHAMAAVALLDEVRSEDEFYKLFMDF